MRHGLFLDNNMPERKFAENEKLDADTPLKIMAAGRLIPKKGFDLLIDACAILKEQGLFFQCDILGDGPLRKKLLRQIRKHGLQDTVRLPGFIPQCALRQRLQQCHLFICPSRIDSTTGDRDGIPNVILEAMQAGAIIISSDLPNLLEIVQNRRTGFLFERENADNLATRIQEALNSKGSWNQVTNSSRDKLRMNYNFEANARNIIPPLSEPDAAVIEND